MKPPSTPGAGWLSTWSAATKDHVTGQQAEKEPVGVSVYKELLRDPPSPAWEPMNEVSEPTTSPQHMCLCQKRLGRSQYSRNLTTRR